MLDAGLERDHTNIHSSVEGEHPFEGENNSMNELFEGEHQNDNLAKGENNDNDTICLDQNDEYLELNDNISITGSKNDEMYEDEPLDFDPTYPPLEKRTKNHPKEQVIGNPQDGVLTRPQIRAKK